MVAPQGRSVVLVVNRGGFNGVRVGDWLVHERGSCRAQEVYPYRAKCTMRDVTAEDISNRTGMTIWPAEMVSDALAAKWTTTEPPEPQAPPEPAPGVREPAPRLVVYRRFDETRFTHHCLGFTPDGMAAYLLRGGSYRGATHEPLVLTRFAVDGTTSERLIGDADATDEAMRVLDELRAREGLLACHEGEHKHLPNQGPTLDPGGTLQRSRFCVAMHDSTPAGDPDYGPRSKVLGCKDTTPLADQSATFSFTPSWSEAPSSFTSPFFLIGQEDGEEDWGTPTTPSCPDSARVTQSITGSLAITACVRHIDDTATPSTCDSGAATCDDFASTPDVCVAGGSLFTVAVNGPAGTRYAVCSVAPAGFEGATADEFRCVGAEGADTEPDLFTAVQVAAQFGDGFCGSPAVGP